MITFFPSDYSMYSPSTRALLEACYTDVIHLDTIRGLLENSTEPPDVNAASLQGETLLHRAIDIKRLDLMQLLMDKGANVNAENKYHITPLSQAISQTGSIDKEEDLNKFDITPIKLLLDKGADPDRDSGQSTPLSSAVTRGLVNVMELLLTKGADINKTTANVNQDRALHFAIMYSNNDLFVLRSLINKKPNLDARNKKNKTPLMLAAEYLVAGGKHGYVRALPFIRKKQRDIETLGTLILAGADTDITLLQNYLSQEECTEIKRIIDIFEKTKQKLIQVEEMLHIQRRLPQECVDMIFDDSREERQTKEIQKEAHRIIVQYKAEYAIRITLEFMQRPRVFQ